MTLFNHAWRWTVPVTSTGSTLGLVKPLEDLGGAAVDDKVRTVDAPCVISQKEADQGADLVRISYLPVGTLCGTWSRTGWMIMGVSTAPGDTELTVMPVPQKSMSNDRVRFDSPALDAA